MAIDALIFDFDGVIADSETLANSVLAEAVTALGCPTTLDESLARYMGKRWPEVIAAIERDIGRAAPEDFSGRLKADTLARFRNELREIDGAAAFIREFSHLPRCIASTSSLDRLQVSLAAIGLESAFGKNIFSADMVSRGKPHPDIFLMAARMLDIPPPRCLVIEDSINGVIAARAAGMPVLGLCAGSHLRAGHDERLRQAGATRIARTWREALAVVSERTRPAVADIGRP